MLVCSRTTRLPFQQCFTLRWSRRPVSHRRPAEAPSVTWKLEGEKFSPIPFLSFDVATEQRSRKSCRRQALSLTDKLLNFNAGLALVSRCIHGRAGKEGGGGSDQKKKKMKLCVLRPSGGGDANQLKRGISGEDHPAARIKSHHRQAREATHTNT